MKNLTTACPSCKGTGTAPLSGALTKTLSHFKHGSKLTAAQIYDKEGTDSSVNAVNNRLEKLRKDGFLKRTRDGQHYIYRRLKEGELPDLIEPPKPRQRKNKAT